MKPLDSGQIYGIGKNKYPLRSGDLVVVVDPDGESLAGILIGPTVERAGHYGWVMTKGRMGTVPQKELN